jgi:hypothetical protein
MEQAKHMTNERSMSMPQMHASIFFQGGTLVLQQTDAIEHVPVPFQFVKSRWRCEAYHYQAVLPWMQEQAIRNAVPRWQRLALELSDTRELHTGTLITCSLADGTAEHPRAERRVLGCC